MATLNETLQQKQLRLKKDAVRKKKRRKRLKQSLSESELRVIRRNNNDQVRKSRKRTRNPIFLLQNGIEDYDSSKIQTLDLGDNDVICPHCNAKLWKTEIKGSKKNPEYSWCCYNGKIKLDQIPEPPAALKRLYLDNTSINGKYFHDNIRRLNCALALAWFDATEIKYKGISPVKINGMIHNKIGSLVPKNGKQNSFAQIYILAPQEQLNQRMKLNGLTGKQNEFTSQAKEVLSTLQNILMKCNPLVRTIRNAFEQSKHQRIPELTIILDEQVEAIAKNYAVPVVNEIAAIIPTSNPKNVGRSIVIPYKSGRLHRIDETNPLYDPLQYILFYPYGTLSWPKAVDSTSGMFMSNLPNYSQHQQKNKKPNKNTNIM